ncbi:MAG: hypothetical protein E7773_04225 [Sphingomonas sp.]|uniref:hypothetical protein n=1 Tax=Sphingomonas sp. TaxID=28214 RepID=UPI0012011EF4|nr:hypothetical protein [Sphingomonas sp.]THD37249.1 MAG: hypothetical protein E7773_04225 [Sphingomonas sp.]
MAVPFDVVVTIGGQSFVDGLWRIFGPALERLQAPLPIALPGFANARMRITNLIPEFPGTVPTDGLEIVATIELTAEALIHVLTRSDGVQIALGPQPVELPAQTGSLTNIVFSGPLNIGTGAGALNLPPLSGTLGLPATLDVPGIPLPAVAPVPLDLTPNMPLIMSSIARLSVSSPTITTRPGLMFVTGPVGVLPPTLIDPNLAATLLPKLQSAVDVLIGQLALPVQVPIDIAMVDTLIAPIAGVVRGALDEALTLLVAETGRVIFPAHDGTTSCDVGALPSSAHATLTASAANGYNLQVAFLRPGSTGTIETQVPNPNVGTTGCHVLIGNAFVLDLLVCLVEQLPAFVLPKKGVIQTTPHHDVRDQPHRNCVNFTGVTASFGAFALGGGPTDGISVCIDGQDNEAKTFSLVGKFVQDIPNPVPFLNSAVSSILKLSAEFVLPVTFDLDDVAALSNLRVIEDKDPLFVDASVSPSWALIAAILVFGALSGVLAFLFASAAIVIVVLDLLVVMAIYLVCGVLSYFLSNAVPTVLAGASLVKSPVAVPPGVFEAFGKLSPVTVKVDDLTSFGVLHTPVSPWALLPRIGVPRRKQIDGGDGGSGPITTTNVPPAPPHPEG